MRHLHTGRFNSFAVSKNNAIYNQDLAVLCIYFKIKLIIIYAAEEDYDYSVI